MSGLHERVPVPLGPVVGGDASLDDDPMGAGPGRACVSGCAVGGTGGEAPAWLTALLLCVALGRRRRRRAP